MKESPATHHAWANFDRFALAKGFQRNDFNFFLPETYVLNPLFESKSVKPQYSSITSVDFPIHEYLLALMMDLSGFSGFWVYRIYILLWSYLGLYFLYKLCRLVTNDNKKSLFVVLVAALSPVFVFYQIGFLPTIPSLTCLIIALYYYWIYLHQTNSKEFVMVLVFLLVAALPRTSFIPALLVIAGFDLFLNRLTYLNWYRRFLSFSIIILLLFVYYKYNTHLRDQYGSIFLSSFKGADNFNDLIQTVKQVFVNFGFSYFSWWQYLILIGIVSLSLKSLECKKIKVLKINKFTLLIILLLLQGIFVFVVMIKQFVYHDYYFLDTFFVPIIILIGIVIKYIPEKIGKYSTTSILLFSLIPCVWFAKLNLSEKFEYKSNDKHWLALKAFEGSEEFLNEQGISNHARILVIDAYTPNMALSLMNRKGYSLLTTTHESISKALQWDFDYVVIANDLFVSELYNHYPNFINEFDKIADNKRIGIYKKAVHLVTRTLTDFLKQSIFSDEFNLSFLFDSVRAQNYQANKYGSFTNFLIDSVSENGIKLISMNKTLEYGLTYKTNSCPILKEKNCLLQIQMEMKLQEIGEAEIVVSVNEKGELKHYQTKKLKDLFVVSKNWSSAEILFNIPKVIGDNYELVIYFWSKNQLEGSIKKFDIFLN